MMTATALAQSFANFPSAVGDFFRTTNLNVVYWYKKTVYETKEELLRASQLPSGLNRGPRGSVVFFRDGTCEIFQANIDYNYVYKVNNCMPIEEKRRGAAGKRKGDRTSKMQIRVKVEEDDDTVGENNGKWERTSADYDAGDSKTLSIAPYQDIGNSALNDNDNVSKRLSRGRQPHKGADDVEDAPAIKVKCECKCQSKAACDSGSDDDGDSWMDNGIYEKTVMEFATDHMLNAPWKKWLDKGDPVDVRDKDGVWYRAEIMERNEHQKMVRVNFEGWGDEFDEWISLSEIERFAPLGLHSCKSKKKGLAISCEVCMAGGLKRSPSNVAKEKGMKKSYPHRSQRKRKKIRKQRKISPSRKMKIVRKAGSEPPNQSLEKGISNAQILSSRQRGESTSRETANPTTPQRKKQRGTRRSKRIKSVQFYKGTYSNPYLIHAYQLFVRELQRETSVNKRHVLEDIAKDLKIELLNVQNAQGS